MTFPGEYYSLAIVDTIGIPPLNLNFMTHEVLNAIFEDFGKPIILGNKRMLTPGIEILFRSMTEALAASMFLGEWYCFKDKTDSFVFRARITNWIYWR